MYERNIDNTGIELKCVKVALKGQINTHAFWRNAQLMSYCELGFSKKFHFEQPVQNGLMAAVP